MYMHKHMYTHNTHLVWAFLSSVHCPDITSWLARHLKPCYLLFSTFGSFLFAVQLLACVGMVAFSEEDSHTGWRHYAQFVTLLVGVFASRCWTAALALALCLLHTRSLCFVLKAQIWFCFLGFGWVGLWPSRVAVGEWVCCGWVRVLQWNVYVACGWVGI